MSFEVSEKGPILRHVSVVVPGEALGGEEKKSLATLRKTTKLKGFRAGKVPVGVIRKMYGGKIRMDAMQHLARVTLSEVLDGIPNVIHMSPYRITNGQTEDGGFAFEVELEVKPTIEPTNYLGIEVAHTPESVPEGAIESELQRLQESYTTLENVDGRDVIEDGDLVTVAYTTVVPGGPDRYTSADDTFEIGTDRYGFFGVSEALLAKKLEETVEVEVKESVDSEDTVRISVTPTAIRKRVVPALDDEFVKRVDREVETLDELKTKIREYKKKELEYSNQVAIQEKLLLKLREAHTFELPMGYIAGRVEQVKMERGQYFLRMGLPADRLPELLDNLGDTLLEQVSTDLQNEVILEAIAATEKIEVGERDRQEYIEHQAQRMGVQAANLRRRYSTPEMAEVLNLEARQEKTLAFLVDRAKVVEIEAPAQEKVEAETSSDE